MTDGFGEQARPGTGGTTSDQRWRQPGEGEAAPRQGRAGPSARRADDRDRCDSGQRNPPARALPLPVGPERHVMSGRRSCHREGRVSGEPPVSGLSLSKHHVSAPSRPSAVEVRDADGDRQCGRSAHADTANECKAAAEDLARYLDTGLPATGELLTARELLAAFLNDLSNECLTRWGPQVRSHRHSTSEPLE